MSKKTSPEGPTRGTIQAFLRERHWVNDTWTDPACADLRRRIDELEKELLDDPRLKELRKEQAALERKLRLDAEAFNKKMVRVRRLYQTHGLTPRVVRAFQELADEFNAADGGGE